MLTYMVHLGDKRSTVTGVNIGCLNIVVFYATVSTAQPVKFVTYILYILNITRVVTKINGHGDKRSSEIPT